MPTFATLRVVRELTARPGYQLVELADGSRAFALTELTGPVTEGDDVVVNTTAVDLGLGTGGAHVVHWNLSRRAWTGPQGGHVMKLRYTSLQTASGAAAEHGSPDTDTLAGVPVVVLTLHSQLAGVVAAIARLAPHLRTVFVQGEGGALPLALSDLVAGLRGAGLLAGTVTTGHAFGGDVEAVSAAEGLCSAAGQLAAHIVVAGPGPGIVGTGTRFGTSAIDAVPVLDLAAALGGRPVLCVRASELDPRARHRGISHHTRTVAELVRTGVDLPVPAALAREVARLAEARTLPQPSHRVVVCEDPGAADVLEQHGIAATTMGRDARSDRHFWGASVAAGVHAVSLIGS